MNNSNILAKAKREYKDSLFRMIFNDKEKLLELYNAVNDTHYTNAEELQIVTLENAIYMNMKNDLAFLLNFRLNMYEHQSTFNPNMPLRDLLYVAKEYEKLVVDKSLYASSLVKIPTPCFIVFYNGVEEQAEERILKLSDSFEVPAKEPVLELKVKMLNMNLDEAVEKAVKECIQEDILTEFLTKYRAEAVSVSIFEYNEEKEIALIRRAEYDEGIKEGELRFLIKMVCKKLEKGKDMGNILAEIEEEKTLLREICDVAQSFAPEYDVEKIYRSLTEKGNK